MSASQDTATAARGAVVNLVFGSMSAQVVGACVKLGVADALDDDERSVEEVAAACGTLTGTMHRLLRAATALELVVEPGPGRFALSAAGRLLRSTGAGSFNTAMSQGTHMAAAVLPGAYDFGRFAAVADVGGGDGTLLVVEPVLPDAVADAAAPVVYLSDLNMLVNLGGRERTRAEVEVLLRGGGFAVVEVVPLPPSGFCLVEAAAV
ncbi:hypothetical protein GCM10010492_66360 [Saccharothrix mutabilis subsp. mutabilis]|uniref:O-methyltransferase n=1 Tax=Saccharothrix mutabilis subsp. mutabilis TaxID=66855 RepID=A0ABN0UN93_9PSEU